MRVTRIGLMLIVAVLVMMISSPARALDNQLITMASSTSGGGGFGFGCDFAGLSPFRHARNVSFNVGLAAATPLNRTTLLSRGDFGLEGNVKIAMAAPSSGLPALCIGAHLDLTNGCRGGAFIGLAFGSL